MSERDVARALLAELLEGVRSGNGNGGAPGAAAPQVPAPPVAAVLRPSTWSHAPAPGEVIGGGSPPSGETAAAAEPVTIESDADLERFVRALAERLEDAGERAAVRAGRRRFTLGRAGGGAPATAPAGVVRIERGAVTERAVAQAARAGARIVLGARAVLTPLAREKARAAGVTIEREGGC